MPILPELFSGVHMKKIADTIDKVSEYIGKAISIFSVLVVVIILYEVVMRYGFDAPTSWASETSVGLCAFLYVLGGAWTLAQDKHVKVELLYDRGTRKTKALLDIITFPFFLLYIGMMSWSSMIYALESIKLGETSGTPWNPPIYPLKIALALGFILLLIQGLVGLYRNVVVLAGGEKL
jgi:TRAP-type mannitol/chloroaromatic compound transport system permease small subunit